MFYVLRRRVPDAPEAGGAPALERWASCFPAHMYGALTIVHRGRISHALTHRLLPATALSGAMSTAASCEYHDAPETTVVVFRPGRLTDLCRLPAGEFTDRWIDTNAVLPIADQIELDERMAAQPTPARQIRVLEQLLERRLAASAGSESQALARAVRERIWQLPHMKVSELAEAFGWTPRRLERRFQATFGVTPKLLMRLARLQLALVHLQRRAASGPLGLAGVSAASGYADPSHLAREVRALAGMAPTALALALRAPGSSAWAYAVPQDSVQPMEPACGRSISQNCGWPPCVGPT